MNKLILLGVLVTSLSYAQNEIQNQSKEIVSRIKDIEIAEQLKSTSQFASCRKFYEIKKYDNENERTAALKAATDCFQKELKNVKDPNELKKLSNSLKLQQYGLVKSDNVKEIQNYLTDKMEQALTGVDPKQVREAATRKQYFDLIKKKKLVDQSVFIDLYKTQVGKNALFEISRYCFENLRIEGKKTPENFADYWDNNLSYLTGSRDKLTDTGEPSFGKDLVENDEKDKSAIYEKLFKKIGANNLKEEFLNDFFINCGMAINYLCDQYKKTMADKSLSDGETAVKDKPTTSRGAASCLTRSRLIEYREALANADKIIKQFETDRTDKDMGKNMELTEKILNGRTPKEFFNDNGGAAYDDLTNHSSADMFAGKNIEANKTCEDHPENPECEKYYTNSEELVKAEERVEREMTLRREVELKRVKELKAQNDQSLPDYLKENGFFDLLEKHQKGENLSNEDLENAVKRSFEAQKLAIIDQMNNRLGKRQVSAKDKEEKGQALKDAVKEGMKESKEERARLAQVVLFNNIISSHIGLTKSDGSDAGKNVKAWKAEEAGLASAQVDPKLFDNLKTNDNGSSSGNGKISGFEIIDKFLGDTSKQQNGN